MESFKRRYRTKNRIPLICCILIIVLVLFLSTGFAAFFTQLSISAMATIRVQRDIRITNVSAINGTNGATSNYEDYNVHSITSAVNLPNANSTITYHIEVTNVGNVEQGIYAIDEIYKHISTNTDSDLEIKSKTVNLKESLCDDTNSSQCKLGSVTTFDITIGYKNNGYDGNNLTHLVQLDFDFRRMFDITYVGFSGNTSGLPNKMIDGDTKTITFDNTSGIPYSVIVTGATGSYSSPTLTLSNITIQNLVDTIVVTRAFSVTYTGFTGNTSGLISIIAASGGTITFDNTTGIPSNVAVTGATASYSSPNLTLTNVTGNVTISNAYSVTYIDFTGDTSGLISSIPTTGGTIVFNNTTGIPSSVTVTGATGSYTSPNLTLTNVTGNVTISNAYSVTYIDFTGDTSGLISSIPTTGGTIVFNNTTGIPSSVTVTGATGSYTSPTLTLTNITGSVTITASFSGSGTTVKDNTTTTYDPDNIPANSDITYTQISGQPNVVTDSNGTITDFEFTTASEQNPVTISANDTLETGFIPFDNNADWEMEFEFIWNYNSNHTSSNNATTILSCGDWTGGLFNAGFEVRIEAKSTSTQSNSFLTYSNGTGSTNDYIFVTNNSARIYSNPLHWHITVTKVGTSMTMVVQNIGELDYKTTGSNSTRRTETNPSVTKTWSGTALSTNDIVIGGYRSANGELASSRRANIDVVKFSIHKTN